MLVYKNAFKGSVPVLVNLKPDDAKTSDTQYQRKVNNSMASSFHAYEEG